MENSKIYTIFAGINGAGKSTLYHTLGTDKFGIRLNSDEFLAEIGLDWNNMKSQAFAGKKVLELQDECFLQGLSMNRETTLAGINIFRSVKRAKELGYKINLLFVGVDSLSIAKSRIEKRIQQGGHGVSDILINYRYESLNKNLMNILPFCNTVQFFDNSGPFVQLVAYKTNKEFVKIVQNCKWFNNLLNELEENKINNSQKYN